MGEEKDKPDKPSAQTARCDHLPTSATSLGINPGQHQSSYLHQRLPASGVSTLHWQFCSSV